MAHPKRKTSRMQARQRKAANRYKGIQINKCSACGAPYIPHQVCQKCGVYNGVQILNVEA